MKYTRYIILAALAVLALMWFNQSSSLKPKSIDLKNFKKMLMVPVEHPDCGWYYYGSAMTQTDYVFNYSCYDDIAEDDSVPGDLDTSRSLYVKKEGIVFKDSFDEKSDIRFIRVEDYIMEGEKLLDMEGLKFIEGKLIIGR